MIYNISVWKYLFSISAKNKTLGKTRHTILDIRRHFRSNPQPFRSDCRECPAAPATDRPPSSGDTICDFQRNCRKVGFSSTTVEKVTKQGGDFPA